MNSLPFPLGVVIVTAVFYVSFSLTGRGWHQMLLASVGLQVARLRKQVQCEN